MKNKIFKIMGVALALVLAFTLGVAFMPASNPTGPEAATAGDLSWSKIGVPSKVGNVLVRNDEDLGPVAISPNFAADSTVFAVINEDDEYPTVYKSTNGGHTWAATTTELGDEDDEGIALEVSPNYAEDSTVFVATQDPANGGSDQGIVYRSTNGGASFGQLGAVTLGTNEIITSMDVSPNYDGVGVVVVGVAERESGAPAAATTSCLQWWGVSDVLSWQEVDTGLSTAVDVSAVEFSPAFAIDSTILVVASEANDEPYLRAVVGGRWDSGIDATKVGAGDVDDLCRAATGGNDLVFADIALPSDYDSTVSTLRRAYVAIASEEDVGVDGSNIYRVTGTTTGKEIATDTEKKFSNLDYNGTFSEGTLIAGLYAATTTQADVYRTTNPTASVVNWYAVSGGANKPTGVLADGVGASANLTAVNTTIWVKMSTEFATDSTVIVGTQGKDSAFGISTNGAASFNETGLIENGATDDDLALDDLMDIALSPKYASDDTMFLTSDSDSLSDNDTNVWVTTNGGSYWDRCFTEDWTTPKGVIAVSNEFGTDAVVYVGDQGSTDIYYTANGGQTWSGRAVSGVNIQTLAAPDATTIYVGETATTGRVAKSTNSGWTWPSSLRKATAATGPIVSLKVKESTVLAGGNAGTVRRSDDGGATWSKISGTLTSAAVYVEFDGGTVYAAESGEGDIYRSVDGGGWVLIGQNATGSDTGAKALELIIADDGTLYELDNTAATSEVNRSINPTAEEPTPGVYAEDVPDPPAVTAVALSVVPGSTGNVIAFVESTGDTLRMYNDILSAGTAGPELVAPEDGSTLTTGGGVRFTVEAIPKVTQFTVIWAVSEDFANYDADTIDAPATELEETLREGKVTYWKVRANAPLHGPYSEVWTVSRQLTTEILAPTPLVPGTQSGSTVNVLIEPVFNWSAFKYADGYEFQLAKDSGMTDLIVDLTGASALGNVTSWKCITTLDYSATYYWRVRAILGGGNPTDWSAISGFTTMSKPVEPAPPVIIEPTPAPITPAPITPAYIYAIIAIGAVLVIVVIVLIVRTRRVP